MKSKTFNHKTVYNDLQALALKNKTLNRLFNKLKAKGKKVIISGSGGSIIEFN
jgi:4-diphosphocytidyl-2C-methyl-D-erythritol kinase